jgi:CTP:molybdopterin cytidylyltransferase MocA
LAAGEGKRMKSALPKVLHPVAGRSLLGHVLEAAATVEPAHVVVVVGHGRDQVTEHLSEIAPWALTVVQEEQKGTGHAVRIALAEVRARGLLIDDAPVVVLTGDTPLLTGGTLIGLLLEHAQSNAVATVLTAAPKCASARATSPASPSQPSKRPPPIRAVLANHEAVVIRANRLRVKFRCLHLCRKRALVVGVLRAGPYLPKVPEQRISRNSPRSGLGFSMTFGMTFIGDL